MRALFPFLLLITANLLGGCHRDDANRTIRASVIGATLAPNNTRSAPLAAPAAMVAAATGLGLVRLDRDGQVIAGAALRWAILDDGLDYIFRIDDAAGIPARELARRLRAAIGARRDDPRRASLAAVESIRAVTTTVVELRLATPQPDLLILLASPDFAVGAPGAMDAKPIGAAQILLLPRRGVDPRPSPLSLRADSADRAVASFVAGKSDLVVGGTFDDLPTAQAARPGRSALRFDPATGLFGLVLRNPSSPVAAAAIREALSLAIDRDRIVAALDAGRLAKATTLAGSTIEPSLEDRRTAAGRLMAGTHLVLTVALPDGPGGRRLFRQLAQDWATIGVEARAVAAGASADLALVDAVVPPGSRASFACAVSAGCDWRDRLALIAPPYIPIATPVRWSLVGSALDQFEENGLAAHPLDRLASR